MSAKASNDGTFVNKLLNGDALLQEIDDYVDEWHNSDSTTSISEFLGFTQNEYALWVENPDILPYIVSARRDGISWQDVQSLDNIHRLAARSSTQEDVVGLIEWLKTRGHID